MLNNRNITRILSSVFICAVAGLSTQVFAASINEVMQEGENRANAGETAQNQIDSVADQTEKIVKDAVADSGVGAEVEKVTDIMEIAGYGVFGTPAVVIDGDVKSVGKIPKKEEVLGWLSA